MWNMVKPSFQYTIETMSEPVVRKSWLNRLIGHFSTITRHKFWVGYYCFKVGLIKQGLLHDLSKYSYIEFSSGVRFYQGNRSPIDKEKEILGISYGWLHHIGHNAHHWEHFVDLDRTNMKLRAYRMPDRYVLESICDRLAACRIYQGKNVDKTSPLNYFLNGKDQYFMHEENASQFKYYLGLIAQNGFEASIPKLRQLNHK